MEDHCQKVVDKYVEFDPVIILLDVLLFKPQAYRHILFNMTTQFQWKLCVFCLLCGAYLKWALHNETPSHKDDSVRSFLQYALQIDFYIVLLLTAIDLAAYLGGIHVACKLYAGVTKRSIKQRLPVIHNAIILSQAGKLLVIPAVIWGQYNIQTCFWLTELFVFTFVSQSLRVTLSCSRLTITLLLVTGYLSEITVSQLGQTLLKFLLDR
ncbi:protein ARV1-like isoform X2 [Apostichopus japonicus]|uniref:protein ARV1-like isoform X2 n=1 Tax=Stichopus japonicus TaxID=307972 RepID=UPI003AB837D1